MKIAIFNPFIDKFSAETELSKRIYIAASNLGWETLESGSSFEVKTYKPDFVLMLHFNTPKLFEFPTYGCMWNPPIFFEKYGDAIGKPDVPINNILSYDAYLSSGGTIDSWIEDNIKPTNKIYFTVPFYTSCNKRLFSPPSLTDTKLVYIGTNWDGFRFKRLFKHLDSYSFMQVYGAESGWEFLKNSYQGSLPFDGSSVLEVLNKAGVGLCLHKKEHCDAEVPSMRIFEIVASGAVAICAEHPFIRETFGNTVFYLNNDLNARETCEQIAEYMSWIGSNPQQALEMAHAAHSIFNSKLSLESLLNNISSLHNKVVEQKGFQNRYSKENSINESRHESPQKNIQFIVRVGGRDSQILKRCLDSIANQTYQYVSVIIVRFQTVAGLDELLQSYVNRMPIQVIDSPETGYRSTQIIDGVKALKSEYFAILDDDDVIYPNHIQHLVSLLENYPDVGVAYSGAIRIWESTKPDTQGVINARTSTLAHFKGFDIRQLANLNNFVVSNSFVARTSCICNAVPEDPNLSVAEDLFLLLTMSRQHLFKFSYEVTCEHYWSESSLGNISLEGGKPYQDKIWSLDGEKILRMFWNKSFIFNIDNSQRCKSEYSFKTVSDMYLFQSPKVSIPLGVDEIKLPLSFLNVLRVIYLRLTGGGVDNPSPSFFAKSLIYIKRSFF